MRVINELSRDDAAAAGSTRGRLGSDRGDLRSLRTANSRPWPYRSGYLLPDNCRVRLPGPKLLDSQAG